MAAATSVFVPDRPGGNTYTGTFTLDAASIAAGARGQQTVACPGVQVGDVIVVRSRTASALIVAAERVTSAGNFEFYLENNSAGAVDEASSTYDFAVIRGTTAALR